MDKHMVIMLQDFNVCLLTYVYHFAYNSCDGFNYHNYSNPFLIIIWAKSPMHSPKSRGGSRTAATSKMERLLIIVNDWKPLTIITKRSILDVATALDPPLNTINKFISSICRVAHCLYLQRNLTLASAVSSTVELYVYCSLQV